MVRVVLASANLGKLRELGVLLGEFDFELVPQSNFPIGVPDETGTSFEENALLKARYAAAGTGLAAIADDSGIAVDALQGAPGIFSARYAGGGARDEDNVNKLLWEMKGVPEGQRCARFECVVVFVRGPQDPSPLIGHGTWHGRVLFEPRGMNGFGYDPVFYVPEQGCACAELSPTTKNAISHRGQAIRQLLARLRTAEGVRPPMVE